ncbi:sulfotransferase-like domain-containing protein [Histidinibacterium aquaticum]|uniref:Sulfotransferase n=1 Tax=Histidinibacterium aquaticum TaxID=2613962 RepID=A0A5J5GFM7_9RHOB|nr:sulfotransferase [Histidinibacterium aquaticum]KAA9006887.1 sulfotransferase [Histidinibacterium aquaticum]
MKIACWSGPRNLSTAMMYAFAARGDCAVWDEPFYAPYLVRTGRADPMRDEIIASHETDPNLVGAMCGGSIPEGKSHYYMKHMALHMLPDFPLDWAESCTHVHLLRHPARVIASYSDKRDEVTADDIGFHQQAEIFDKVGGVVVDSADIRADPGATLRRLCEAIGLDYRPEMLRWPEGGHRSDGVWAAHWYEAIHRSTGFAGAEGDLPELTGRDAALAEEAMPHYEKLLSLKI